MSEQKRTLTVKGMGKESFTPDLTVVSMTVETVNPDYSKTTAIQAEKIAEVTNTLTGAGFDKKDLTTSDYNINTEYESYQENNKWKRRFKGYHCEQSLNLRFEQCSETLNKALTALSSCKKSVPQFNISFTVKDKDKVSDTLLALAVADAKRKAEVLAKAAGVTITKITEVNYAPIEIDIYSPTRLMDAAPMMKMAAADTAAPEINPEKISAQASVVVVWEIE